MDQKTVKKYSFKWQADMLVTQLEGEHITAFIIDNPREYSSIITGIGSGGFSVVVDTSDLSKALEVESQLSRSSRLSLAEDPADFKANTPLQLNHFKKLIVFTFLTVLLPLVFNLVATIAYFKVLGQNISHSKKIAATFLFLIGWIVMLAELRFIYRVI